MDTTILELDKVLFGVTGDPRDPTFGCLEHSKHCQEFSRNTLRYMTVNLLADPLKTLLKAKSVKKVEGGKVKVGKHKPCSKGGPPEKGTDNYGSQRSKDLNAY